MGSQGELLGGRQAIVIGITCPIRAILWVQALIQFPRIPQRVAVRVFQEGIRGVHRYFGSVCELVSVRVVAEWVRRTRDFSQVRSNVRPVPQSVIVRVDARRVGAVAPATRLGSHFAFRLCPFIEEIGIGVDPAVVESVPVRVHP